MKQISTILAGALLLLTGSYCHSQQVKLLRITVLDSASRLPVPNASVVLKSSGKDSLHFATGDSLGVVRVQAAIAGTIRITVSSTGYLSKNWLVNMDTLRGDTARLVPFYLQNGSRQLAGVTVTAQAKPLVKQEIDRLVYNVTADAESPSLSALEMMAKVPLLSVDGDENIKLKGSSSYRIFINGRPSALTAGSPKEALRVMRASTVVKIEVITTPPAKYDAEGLAGIINIVLKKQTVNGYNASIGSNYNNTIGFGENASLTAKWGKWGLTGRLYTFQDFKRTVAKAYDRESTGLPYSRLLQEGTFSYVGNYQSGGAEWSYEADSLNLLTASFSLVRTDYDDYTTLRSLLTGAGATLLQAYRTENSNPQLEKNIDFDLNYQHGFRRYKDQLLTFSYQQRNLPNQQSSDVLFFDKTAWYQPAYRQYNANNTVERTIQADFVKPLPAGNIEAGVKTILRQVTSDATTEIQNGTTGSYEYSNSLGSSLNYYQDIYGAYGSFNHKFKPVEIKAGVRLEQTHIRADYQTANSILRTHYTNLIPVVSLQHRFTGSSIKLAYTQRISRPGIVQLNPFVDKLNPQFIRTGNPALRPVLSNNFELSYGSYKKANISISASYSFANNAIQQVTTLSDSISFTTYQNTGTNKTLGLNAGYSQSLTNTLSVYLNSELTYLFLSGSFDGQNFSNRGIQGYAYINWVWRFHPLWRATTSLTFVSANVVLQGHTNAFVFNSYRLYRDLFKKKLTLSVAVSNPYSKFRYIRTTIEGKGYQQQTSEQKYYRMFAASLSYNFGSLKATIKKNQRSISNDDVQSSK